MKIKKRIYRFIASITPRKLLYWMVLQVWIYTSTEKHTNKQPDEITWGMACEYMQGKKV